MIGDAFPARAGGGIFVTGDTVKAATDDLGNHNLMTCQHAMRSWPRGRPAMRRELRDYRRTRTASRYVTCLDLGPGRAVYRKAGIAGAFYRQEGKRLKEINTQWIYPPAADREALFAIATRFP
ncbi:hypothetical protein M8494_02780 [Serratia ureilytica]